MTFKVPSRSKSMILGSGNELRTGMFGDGYAKVTLKKSSAWHFKCCLTWSLPTFIILLTLYFTIHEGYDLLFPTHDILSPDSMTLHCLLCLEGSPSYTLPPSFPGSLPDSLNPMFCRRPFLISSGASVFLSQITSHLPCTYFYILFLPMDSELLESRSWFSFPLYP